jgi:WD40 repeat protein/beta-lactamase regulating signal transducer with metallopeptidase domain
MNAVLEIAVNNAIAVAVLAAAVVLYRFLRSGSAVSHCLWVLLLMKLVTPPLFRIAVPQAETTAGIPSPGGHDHRHGPLHAGAPQDVSSDPRGAGSDRVHSNVQSGLADADLPASESQRKERWFVAGGDRTSISDAASPAKPRPDESEGVHLAAAPPSAQQSQAAGGDADQPVGWLLLAYHPAWGLIWLCGSLLCVTGLVVRIVRFEQCLKLAGAAPATLQDQATDLAHRLGLSRCPQIVVVPGRLSPMLWSFGKTPRILFPSALLDVLTERQRATLLLHELFHYRRGDHWVRLLECLVTVLYWWYPLVWWIRRQLRDVEEACCDERVIAELPGDRESYASALLATISLTSQCSATVPPLACGIGGYESVRRRLTGIMLAPTRGRLSNWSKLVLALLAFVVLPLFPALARLQPTLAPTPDESRERSLIATRQSDEQPLKSTRSRLAPFRPLRDPHAGSDTFIPPLASLLSDAPPKVVTFAADGNTLVVADAQGHVLLYDLRSGAGPRSLVTGRPFLSHIAVAPTGDALALGWPDGVIHVWSSIDDQTPTELPQLTGRLHSLAYSSDGRQLLAGSISRTGNPVVETWDSVNHRSRTTRLAHAGVEQLVLSTDGRLLATTAHTTSSLDVRIWDVASGQALQQFAVPASGEEVDVTALRFSPGNSLLLAADRHHRVFAWDIVSGRLLPEIETSAAVQAIAAHPDSRHVALLQSDGTFELWDVPEGSCRARFEGHPAYAAGQPDALEAGSAAFSSDGSVLASSGADAAVRLWTIAADGQSQAIPADDYAYSVEMTPDGEQILVGGNTGASLRRLVDGTLVHDLKNDATGTAVAVAVSPDGRTAITGGDQHSLQIWDLAIGRSQLRLKGHTDTVRSVAYSPDGQTVLSGAYDGQAIAWDLSTGTEHYRIEGDGSRVNAVVISNDGRLAAVGSTFSTGIHDLATGQKLWTLSSGTPVASVSFSPDSDRLLTAHNDASLRIWDLRDGTQLQHLAGHTRPLESAAFSPDGRFAASGGQDHRLLLWDLQSPQRCLQLGLLDVTIKSVRFSPDGCRVVTAAADGSVRVWDLSSAGEVHNLADQVRRWGVWAPQRRVSSQQPQHVFQSDGRQTAFVVFSPGGQTYATGGSDRVARIHDRNSHNLLAELTGHQAGITSGAYFPDGRYLATASWAPENAVRVWDVATQSQVALLEGHSGPVRMVAVSPDGALLATASEDRTVRLWDALTFQPLRTLPEQSLPVFSVAFSSDGSTFAMGTGSLDPYQAGEISLWDPHTGRRLRTVAGFEALQRSLAFSPDGTRLVAKKSESIISWVESDTQRTGWEIRSAAGPLACSPDGRTLASGQLDGSIRVWDAIDGRLLADFRRNDSHVRWLAFSPDSSLLASAALDGTVMLWEIPQNQRANPPQPLNEHSSAVAHVSAD